jgi:hydrogenase nickel incorporation protein HypB
MCTTCGCEGEAAVHAHGAHDAGHVHASGEHEHHHDHDHQQHAHGGARPRLADAVLERNDRLAERNRGWLAARGILAVNLVSSPGAGKTTLLERTIEGRGRRRIFVIEGDQATTHDADRIRAAGARAVQVNTGAGCHLDASMVERALRDLGPPPASILMIENVGNLVCPALFDLGERAKVLVASVTEGDDKPLKYPHMFRAATLVLLNKIDLAPHVSFDVDRFAYHTSEVNPRSRVIAVSATRGDGLAEWYAWLDETMAGAHPLAGEAR